MTPPRLPPPRRAWWLAPAALLLLQLPPGRALALIALLGAGRLGLSAARRTAVGYAARRAARRASGAGSELTVLGADPRGRAVLLSDRSLAAHGLIVGASGAGKTTTLTSILAAQITRGRPVIAIDLKGSPAFAGQLQAAAAAAGRPFRLWSPDGPSTWNPLARGNATELKDKLIATERFTEPHYRRAAERYVQTALQVMQEAAPERPITLGAVVRMLEPRRLVAATRSLPPERGEHVREYVAALTPDQLSAVRGLATRLAILSESHTGRYLEPEPGSTAAIDLATALGGPEVVLFSLNSSTYGGLSAQLGTLVVQDIVSAAGRRLTDPDPAPATVAIDEFSALGSDNLMSLLARGRESRIGVLLATQELADLDRAARGLRDQVLGNTAVKIAHRQDVPESAEAVARMAGRQREWERTYQLRPGLLGPDLRRGTLRPVDRYAIDPERVRSLATGEAVVIVKSPQASARLTRVAPPRAPDGRGVAPGADTRRVTAPRRAPRGPEIS